MRDPASPDPSPDDRPNEIRNDLGAADMAVQAGRIENVILGQRPRRPSIPRQVPRPAPGWHDRDAEQQRMHEYTGTPSGDTMAGIPICLLEGLRGIGKTALARRFAATTKGRFTHGQLYVDYAQLNPDGLSGANEALGHLLASLGVHKEDVPARLHERVALFCTSTSNRRLLVVIEGATEAAQVRQLVPQGPGSAVVAVGSRERLGELALEHAEWLTLGPLSTDDSAALLTEQCGGRLSGAAADSVAGLVAACGGLPLALVLVAGRIKADPAVDIAALAAELTDEQRRLKAISFTDDYTLTSVFNLAYAGLSAAAASLYRALGCWPGRGFDTALAAAACRGEPATVTPLLDELRRAELITAGKHGLHHFSHDLVRLHAAACAEEHDSEALRGTVLLDCLDAYRSLLAHADLAVTGARLRTVPVEEFAARRPDPFGGDRAKALRRLRAERDTILAVVRAADAHRLDEYTSSLAELAAVLYLNQRFLADWVETGRRGVQAAHRHGDTAREARLCSLVSRPLTDLGRTEEAHEKIERALELVRDEADLLLAASVHEFHGRYLDTDDRHAALRAYARSVRLNERSDDPMAIRGAALGRYFAGRTRLALSETEPAITELSAAVTAFASLAEPDIRMAARACGSLADAYAAADCVKEAIAAYTEAVQALRKDEQYYYEAENLQGLGALYARIGVPEQARVHWSRAFELFTALNSPRAGRVSELLAGIG